MLLVAFLSIQMAAAKDPDTALFKKLDGFQPCEVTELKAGTHVFAVYGTVSLESCLCTWKKIRVQAWISLSDYIWFLVHFVGDNFFKSAHYTIEALCSEPFAEEKENLRTVEAQILSKRVELSKFESEYREVWVRCKYYLFFPENWSV